MKREHMVTVIAECLIEPHYPDDPIKEASYILRKIQSYGMLPPELPGYSMFNRCQECGGSDALGWEPNNENR